MSSTKTERLLNLVICLLSTRHSLTKAQIRVAVPQYAGHASDETFERMFERDKDELRELGIPLVTSAPDPLFDDEVGYRVDRDAYALPQVSFEPDELAVLGLASRVWQQASLAGPATRALTKLTALGAPQDDGSLIGIEPRVHTPEPAFDALWAAVRDRVPVTFGYRTSGQGRPAQRHVEPWAVTSWRGRWYLTAHDRDRGEPRVFRLSRVDGAVRAIGRSGGYDVPPDPMRSISFDQPNEQTLRSGEVRVRAGSGHALRRRASGTRPDGPGWDVLTVEYGETEFLAEELVMLGPAVVVLGPDPLREAVVRRLRAVLRGVGDQR
jgi:proteasome accessory factor B